MSRMGRLIFLKQLESLRNSRIEIEDDGLLEADKKVCSALAEALDVPEYLRAAFNVYCLEYIDAAGRGVFSNGPLEKVHYFFSPVFGEVAQKTGVYDLGLKIFFEPAGEGQVCFLAIAVSRQNQNLPVPFLLYRGCFGSRQPFFTEVPKSVYEELNRIYESAKVNAFAGLRANGVLLPGERPAGIFVRYSLKCGGRSVPCTALVPYVGTVPAEEVVQNFIRNLGEEVDVDSWKVVPKTDYAVLKSYV